MKDWRNWSLVCYLAFCVTALVVLSAIVDNSKAAEPVTRHVATTGTDSGDCVDAENPCRTVQYAVNAASEGESIKVATGVYTGVNNYTGLSQVVYISKTVTVRGGYAVDFTDPPDPEANPTTLDAQQQGRVLYIVGEISATIEGLRITGGDSEGYGGDGGGLYLSASDATLIQNTITDNTSSDAGGGLYLSGGHATLNRNTITGNTARDNGGGGLYLSNSHATLDGNTIAGNTVHDGGGGGIDITEGEVTLSGNTISGNTADQRGGGLHAAESVVMLNGNTISGNTAGEGAGLSLEDSDATLRDNTISGNNAHRGGGLHLSYSSVKLSRNMIRDNIADWGFSGGLELYHSEATLNGNTIIANTSGQSGGGLSLISSKGTLSGNLISRNEAEGGGGLYLSASEALLSGNIISGNTAIEGGGIHFHLADATLINSIVVDNQAHGAGSGLFFRESSARLLHTTIARNTGGDGSGIHATKYWHSEIGSTVVLTNTILVSHTVGITVTAGSTATMEATLWGTDTWANEADWGGEGTIITGTINYWGDPAFVDPDAGDYHVGSGSAAVDAGVDAGITDDTDGQARPHHDGYDLGADEWWPLLAVKAVTPDTAEPEEVVTYTLALTSAVDAGMMVRLTDTLPLQVDFLGPLTYSSGEGGYASGVITWAGTVYTAAPEVVAWAVQIAPDVREGAIITNTADINDGCGLYQTDPSVIRLRVEHYIYLPLVVRNVP